MAPFTFNTLQHKNLFSITLCKYPSTLTSFELLYLSHFHTFSPPKHTLQPGISPLFDVSRAQYVSHHLHAKLSATDYGSSTKIMNLRSGKNSGSGFSSLRTRDERVDRQIVKDILSSVVDKETEKRFTKDKNARKNLDFRKRKGIGSGHSSSMSKDGNIAIKKISKTLGSVVVGDKVEKQTKDSGNNEMGEEKMATRSKKSKADSPEVQLRFGLDMSSKRGDVLGAIQLYDMAQREGTKMGQYHYTLLLYLCSSAALGVVQPAKSGSGSRSSNILGVSNEVSSMNSMELGKLRDNSYKNSSGTELNIPVLNSGQLVDTSRSHGLTNKTDLNSYNRFESLYSSFDDKENFTQCGIGFMKSDSQLLDRLTYQKKGNDDHSQIKVVSGNQEDHGIWVSENVKKYAIQRGLEIYEKMCLDKVPMNEATLTAMARMAMSMGNGDMAFDMVKQMKPLGINPRLRSYGPALSAFCNSGVIDKAFAVEKHMLEHGVYPEEPELEALLRVSVGAGKGDKVYYLLHKLRTSIRKVSHSTADLIVKWFNSKTASRVGKTKWDQRLIKRAIENGGGGWHGQGWLGKGKWTISCTGVGDDGLCKCCGEKLAIIDLDPTETENFAESVASIAIKKEKNSSFQKFQKWIDYYGPFEAVVDAANVGLFSQRRFIPSKVSAIVNGIRQKLPSKKWPLIVLHNKRVNGQKMNEPVHRALIEKWKNADALYATPTGSNDDWYWLYAAIKLKCLLVTNDEMRDHTFQLLGNDFFPKWKERHQVHFSFSDTGPVFYMPPPCSVVIQESEKGHWHIPIASEHDHEVERTWLCITRANSHMAMQDSATRPEESQSLYHNKGHARSASKTEFEMKSQPSNHCNGENKQNPPQEIYKNLRNILSASVFSDHGSILSEIEDAEKLGSCVIDFQI